MDPGRGGPSLDLDGADSDRARIAQATGMFMQLFGVGAPQALALLDVVSQTKVLSTSSFAREFAENWPISA